jgi:hypothetical protein
MEIRTTCALHDLVDDMEFLATLHVKENVASYRQIDYLRHKSRCSGSVLHPNLTTEYTLPCFEEKLNNNVNWEMSSGGRLQVGQWFSQST